LVIRLTAKSRAKKSPDVTIPVHGGNGFPIRTCGIGNCFFGLFFSRQTQKFDPSEAKKETINAVAAWIVALPRK
jgi:hypothetical protein